MMNAKRSVSRLSLLATAIAAVTLLGCSDDSSTVVSQTSPSPSPELAQQFVTPPNEAKPRVWWHWMNGNVTKEGIAKDFDWMQKVGIGGVQTFDVSMGTPQIVDKRLVYMTPEWQEAFRFAATEADKRDLELTIAASPGWSETGGPWVKPENGLKKLVWSETVVEGGQPITAKLSAPPSVTGPYQTLPKVSAFGPMHAGEEPPAYYGDVAVLAFPYTQTDTAQATFVSDSGEPLSAAALQDGDLATAVTLTRNNGEAPSYLNVTYTTPQPVSSATVFMPGGAMPFIGPIYRAELQSSDDGTHWNRVADVPITAVPTTVSFDAVNAAHFRLQLTPDTKGFDILKPLREGAVSRLNPAMVPMLLMKPLSVAELQLSAEPRIDRAEAKAAFTIEPDYFALSKGVSDVAGVDPAQVIHLTDKLQADGSLDWTPPPGRWKIVRMGYSLLGTTNHPAPPEATGLEVDKFDGAAVRDYMEHYLDTYAKVLGEPIKGQQKLDAILTDSIEVGAANWTPKMIEQFTRLRGYDPTPWLPALTGTLIGSRQQSDKFLFDYRRTLADLMASEHYGTVAAVAHEHGLKVYGEALENSRPSLGDDMAMRRYADYPMSAMWASTPWPLHTYTADIKGAASVAHLYGQNIVAAESMTGTGAPWNFAPVDLKKVIDLEFVLGVNRPIVHTSVHVPVDDKLPGLSLGGIGQFFNRTETWADMAEPWVTYMSRSSYLLQQGRYFADVAFFYGEEAPLTGLYNEHQNPDVPHHYGYDYVNTDIIHNLLSVDNGALTASSGARYQVLYLGGSSQKLTLPLLQRLHALVEAGATVIGLPPESSPSLSDTDQAAFATLVKTLWSEQTLTAVGKGRVYGSDDLDASLAALNIAPDFQTQGLSGAASDLPFLHRRLADGDLYYLVNRTGREQTIEAAFRVTGKAPQLWHADSGTIEPVSYRIEGEQTYVPLTLTKEASVFVVFREPAAQTQLTLPAAELQPVATLDQPWTVRFQDGRGAPASATFERLTPWDEHSDTGIKYFSGIGSYSTTLQAPADWKAGEPLWLDLGEVRDLAEVIVNGKNVGIAWHPPYRVDISTALQAGENRVEVRVANLWVNRLIGDQQPGVEHPITYTDAQTYQPDAPLRRSGLMGPVQLLQVR